MHVEVCILHHGGALATFYSAANDGRTDLDHHRRTYSILQELMQVARQTQLADQRRC